MKKGVITKIIGVVIDVRFDAGYVPAVYDALNVEGHDHKLVLEVQQQLGDGVVRTIAMGPVDGLKRGMEVAASEAPISVPVGAGVLGRMFNVLGDPIDGEKAPKSEHMDPIHRSAPAFADLSNKAEVFETGIKVVDLIAPMLKGGKVGLFGDARAYPQYRFWARRVLCSCWCRGENSWREWSLPRNDRIRSYW